MIVPARIALAAAAVLALACRPEPGARAATATRPPVAAAPSADPDAPIAMPVHHDWLTGIVGDLGYASLRPLLPSRSEPESDEPAPPRECARLVPLLTGASSATCAVAPGGRPWVVETRERATDDGSRTGTWRVAYGSGGALRFGGAEPFRVDAGQYSVNRPPVVVHFVDLTGDGVVEAVFAGYEAVNASDVGERFLAIYTAASDGPVPLSAGNDTAPFALKDCNGDRLPELYFDPYRPRGAERGVQFTFYGRRSATAWSLLAEGTASGFRVEGSLSAGYARALCADVTSAALAKLDPGTWPHVVHCRRLSGVATDVLEAELAAACTGAAGKRGEFCKANSAQLAAMAGTRLPVTIASGGPASPECLLPSPVRDDP